MKDRRPRLKAYYDWQSFEVGLATRVTIVRGIPLSQCENILVYIVFGVISDLL